jgi:hypothetical protein
MKWVKLVLFILAILAIVYLVVAGYWKTIAVIVLVHVVIVLQGLRKIPASPPYKGQATFLGKRVEGKAYNEGWGFYPGYPFIVGFILVKVERITFEIASETARTPDRAESKIPVFVTIRPIPKLLVEYIDSGREEGVKKQLTGKIQERIREWAMGPEEGPATWIELNQSHLEAISVLVKQIAGNSLTPIPPYAQSVPTWIWLRFFAQPRPTRFLTTEKPWAEPDWKRVRKVLEEIRTTLGDSAIDDLRVAVDKRRKDIEKLRTGEGKVVLADLGVMLERLNLGDIEVLGETGKRAEQEAKEEQERISETKELTHISDRIQALMAIERPDGTKLSRAEVLELVQLSLGKTTKAIDAKTLTLDPASSVIVSAFLEKLLGGGKP